MDKTTRKQRVGKRERSDLWSFLAFMIVLGAFLGLAGHADLFARGLIN